MCICSAHERGADNMYNNNLSFNDPLSRTTWGNHYQKKITQSLPIFEGIIQYL